MTKARTSADTLRVAMSMVGPAIADSAALASLPAELQKQMRDGQAQMAALNSDSAIYAGVPETLRAPLKQRVSGRLGELWRKRAEAQALALRR